MRNRRRNWLLRRLVLGLAVTAIVAPTAQARLYEGGGTSQSDGNGVVIHGDDKVLADGDAIVIHGDDKVLAPSSDGVLVSGDDKVFAPASDGVLVSGDDKVFAPVPGSDLVYLKGDDKVIMTPGQWQFSQFAYRHAMPQDYRVGDFATQVRDTGSQLGKPAGRQPIVATTGTGTEFNWADGLIGAAAALGLAALAYGAARSTRDMRKTVTG
jgi:hypothetical protein